MIAVDQPDGSLLLVRQIDHAALSADIAERWCRPSWTDAEVWNRFLDAVRCHDDGWTEPDQAPEVDRSGRPLDFKTVHTGTHTAIWRDSIERAAARDPLVGLLVAMHARWLYDVAPSDHIEDHAAADAFRSETAARIIDLTADARAVMPTAADALTDDRLTALRRLLGFFDGLTLTMVGAVRMPSLIEGLPSRDETITVQTQITDDSVTISPWPFSDPNAFGPGVSMPTVRLSQGRFVSAAAFRAALAQAPISTHNWRIVPA